MANNERNRIYQAKYRKENRDIYFNVFRLSDEDRLRMGLVKKPKPLRGTIHIVIPLHYGVKGMWWQSRFVTPAELEGYLLQYPNLQILDEEIRQKYKPEPWDEDEEDEEPEVIEEYGDAPAIDYDDDFTERWEFYR